MVRWHHQLNGCEFAQTQGDSEGQGSLVCCSPWVSKISISTYIYVYQCVNGVHTLICIF